jgi:hypothetical protein
MRIVRSIPAAAMAVLLVVACDAGWTAEQNANEACNEIARSTGLDKGFNSEVPSRSKAERHIEKALQYARSAGGDYGELARLIIRYEKTWKTRDTQGFLTASSDVVDYCIDLQVDEEELRDRLR